MFGGFSGALSLSQSNLAEVYDPSTNSWTTLAPMPSVRSYPAVAVANGRIYVMGGAFRGSPTIPTVWLDVVEEYDPSTNTWATRTPMPTPRMGHGAVTHDGRVYVIGGWNGVLLNTCEEYNPLSDTWTTKASMPTARYMVPCAEMGGLIYAVAGWEAFGPGRRNEVYDPVTDTWATRAPLAVGRYLHGAAALGGRVWAVGGTNGAVIVGVESYDPMTNSWSPEAQLNEPRYRVAAAATATSLYALGGAPDLINVAVNVGSNEELSIAPGVVTYCTAKAGLLCGTPAISFAGTPSASATSGFEIRASPARSNRSGIFIYTDQGRGNIPFLGGTLCQDASDSSLGGCELRRRCHDVRRRFPDRLERIRPRTTGRQPSKLSPKRGAAGQPAGLGPGHCRDGELREQRTGIHRLELTDLQRQCLAAAPRMEGARGKAGGAPGRDRLDSRVRRGTSTDT